MQRTLISSLAMATALMFVGSGAFAHDDGALDKISGPNGGQLRMAGGYHFELVIAKDSKDAKDNPVTVYLTDHGEKKVPSAGATGTAMILAAKSKITVPLAPSGENKLTGIGRYASDPQMKVVVSVTFASAKAEQARFTPLLTAAADGHGNHQH